MSHRKIGEMYLSIPISLNRQEYNKIRVKHNTPPKFDVHLVLCKNKGCLTSAHYYIYSLIKEVGLFVFLYQMTGPICVYSEAFFWSMEGFSFIFSWTGLALNPKLFNFYLTNATIFTI